MTKDSKILLGIGLAFICFAAFFVFTLKAQKAECLSEGGKWATGFIGGGFSAFCIPK